MKPYYKSRRPTKYRPQQLLLFAAHEVGHAALAIPETKWHIGLGPMRKCAVCNESPLPMMFHPDYAYADAHTRDMTRVGMTDRAVLSFESLYGRLAGGAATEVCFGIDNVGMRKYDIGTSYAFPEGMGSDFSDIIERIPYLFSEVEVAYRRLRDFLLPHKDILMSYAKQLVKQRVLYHYEVEFPFDSAEIVFNAHDNTLHNKHHVAYVNRVCFKCGEATTAWGFCMSCRFAVVHAVEARSLTQRNAA